MFVGFSFTVEKSLSKASRIKSKGVRILIRLFKLLYGGNSFIGGKEIEKVFDDSFVEGKHFLFEELFHFLDANVPDSDGAFHPFDHHQELEGVENGFELAECLEESLSLRFDLFFVLINS